MLVVILNLLQILTQIYCNRTNKYRYYVKADILSLFLLFIHKSQVGPSCQDCITYLVLLGAHFKLPVTASGHSIPPKRRFLIMHCDLFFRLRGQGGLDMSDHGNGFYQVLFERGE